MSKVNIRDDFKRDAVSQITERGYPVAEIPHLLGSASIRYMLGRISSDRHLALMMTKICRSGD